MINNEYFGLCQFFCFFPVFELCYLRSVKLNTNLYRHKTFHFSSNVPIFTFILPDIFIHLGHI